MLALAVGAIIVVAVGVFATSSPAHAAGPGGPRWRQPRLVDHRVPFDRGGGLSGVSCASASLCAGLDAAGDVLVTAHPTRVRTWIPTVVDSQATFDGSRHLGTAPPAIACTPGPLCVGVDWKGNVWTSTDPLSGYRSWKRSHLFAGDLATIPSVSCARGPVCAIAVGTTIYASGHPTGGAAAWTAAAVGAPGATFTGIACVAGGWCYAIDGAGDVASSAHPAGGTSAWSLATGVDGAGQLDGISCASIALCAIIDFHHHVLTSTHPSAGPSAWTSISLPLTHPIASQLSGIACPSTSLCVADDTGGDVFVSHTPTAAGTTWRRGAVPGRPLLEDGVACTPSGFCVLAGETIAVSRSAAPDPSAWTVQSPATDELDSIACPAAGRCVATGGADRIFTTAHGDGATPGWRVRDRPTDDGVLSVSCPGLELCVAAGDRGEVLVARHPFSGSGDWRRTVPASTRPTSGVGIACPSAHVCVAVHGGRVSVSRHPDGGAGRWRSWIVDHARFDCPGTYGRGRCATAELTSVSCPSASRCVAGDDDGNVVVSDDPSGGVRRWRLQPVLPRPAGLVSITSISCVRGSGCVAVDSAGDLLRSRHPTAPGGAWTTTEAERAGTVDSVDCTSASRCVAVDDLGRVLRTADIWAPTPTWTYRRIDGMSPLTSVACASPSFCGAVDGIGYATLTR